MKIKSHPFVFTAVLLAVFFLASCKSRPSGNEVPVTTNSKEALKFFLEGRDKFENVEFVSAASLFDKATRADTGFAMAYLYRSWLGDRPGIFQKNLEKAVNLVGKVSEGEKNEILYYQAQADDDGTKQKEYLDRLLLSFPSDKRIHMMAGLYYYDLEDFSNALIHYKKVTELDKDFASAYNRIGYCQSELNHYAEAEKAFLTYIKLVPGKANPYDSYAEFLLKTGNYDQSILQYKKAVALDPVNFAASLLGIGNNFIFKNEYDSARKYYKDYYDQADGINGKLIALSSMATSYVHEGKTAEALKAFDEFRALAEKENLATSVVFSYIDQASILRESGNPADGLKYSGKAIELAGKLPVSVPVRELLITITLTINFDILAANDELVKATLEAEKCRLNVESRKKPAEEKQLNSFLARLEFKKGNYDKALEYFNKTEVIDPGNWYYTAMAYEKTGERQRALKLFKKITGWNYNSLSLAFVRKRSIEELKKLE